MRQFRPGPESGHDTFFATFGKFGAASGAHTAEMLAEAKSRAGDGPSAIHELMFNPDGGEAADWVRVSAGMMIWANGATSSVGGASANPGSGQQVPGRHGKKRAAGDALRPATSCSLVAAFRRGIFTRSLGVSRKRWFSRRSWPVLRWRQGPARGRADLVMRKTGMWPIQDFNLHMQMLDFLHPLYPKVSHYSCQCRSNR